MKKVVEYYALILLSSFVYCNYFALVVINCFTGQVKSPKKIYIKVDEKFHQSFFGMMVDIQSQYMHYCGISLSEFYCVIVSSLCSL